MSISRLGVWTSNPNIYETDPINNQSVDLKAIKGTRGNINEIRLLLKGDLSAWRTLFQEAVANEDAIAQIQLSQALFGIKWGEDHEKDFSFLTANQLEDFWYYPREFDLFKRAYEEAMGFQSDENDKKTRAIQTFTLAAYSGYFPAILELLHYRWRMNIDTYGFAVQLKPFVGRGDKKLDRYFGNALRNGCQTGSKPYYEGLYWIEKSVGFSVKYPNDDQSYESLLQEYILYRGHACQCHDRMCFMEPSDVLAPNKETWQTFANKKLKDIEIASLDSYLFKYDSNEIDFLINEYNIGTIHCSSLVEDPNEGCEKMEWNGTVEYVFPIDTLRIFENSELLGEMSVRTDTLEMHTKFSSPKIQPVLDFIENIMVRTGSARSAKAWLNQLGLDAHRS